MNNKLPIRSPEQKLSDISVAKFQALIADSKIVIQNKDINDYGVDLTLELEDDKNQMTNFRFHSQLKASNSIHPNSDGSFSLPVKVSNLNYLINQPMSIYVLYLEEDDSFHYEWAEKVFQNLIEKRRSGKKQTQITIRFHRRLDSESIRDIHNEVMKFGLFERNLTENINRTTMGIPDAKIIIDRSSLSLYSEEEIIKGLESCGLYLVTLGDVELVFDALKRLTGSAIERPLIQIIRVFALYWVGNYHAAIGEIINVLRKKEAFSDEDIAFVEFIRLQCERIMGHIDDETMNLKIKSIIPRLSRTIQLQHELEIARKSFLNLSIADRQNAIESLRDLKREIDDLPENYGPLKLQSAIVLHQAEGLINLLNYLNEAFSLRIKMQLGIQEDMKKRVEMARSIADIWEKWLSQADELKSRCIEMKNSYLLGDLFHSSALLFLLFEASNKAMARLFGDFSIPINGTDIISQIMNYIEGAQEAYQRVGATHSMFYTLLLKAEALIFFGEIQKAREIASYVKDTSSIIGMSFIESNASTLMKGESLFVKMIDRAHPFNPEMSDYANADDASFEECADDICRLANLPLDCKPFIINEYKVLRTVDNENVSFCRNLTLLQRPTNAAILRVKPFYVLVCNKVGVESPQENQDIDKVISEFKTEYCNNCDKKEVYTHQ